MKKQVRIFDTTLRDGEQSPGCSMNLSEKLEIARQLEQLGVDVIEAGFAISSPDDFKSVQAIAGIVKTCRVASLARALPQDIDRAWEAVKDSKYPMIHTFLATSDIHMRYKLEMTREQVLAQIESMVRRAKGYCEEVEFSAEDASRSDREFLANCYTTAIRAGATVINVPDTVGYATPDEMRELVSYLMGHVVGIENAIVSVHCHNDLGLAVANSIASIGAGATQVECTINGIGERAGNASLEEVAMLLSTRADYFGAECRIDTKQIYRTSRLLSSVIGLQPAPTKPIVGANAFAHEAGIHQHGVLKNSLTYEIMTPESIGIPQNRMVLGKHSGKHAFADRLQSLGYTLSKEEIEEAFKRFKALADRKKVVSDRDIEALATEKMTAQDRCAYRLESFVVNSGTNISATAAVKLNVNGGPVEEVATASGPIEAAFSAISAITKTDAKLENYTINAVTEGRDALGEVIVKLLHDGEIYTGRGLSTDIIEASIRAYINGMDKINSIA